MLYERVIGRGPKPAMAGNEESDPLSSVNVGQAPLALFLLGSFGETLVHPENSTTVVI